MEKKRKRKEKDQDDGDKRCKKSLKQGEMETYLMRQINDDEKTTGCDIRRIKPQLSELDCDNNEHYRVMTGLTEEEKEGLGCDKNECDKGENNNQEKEGLVAEILEEILCKFWSAEENMEPSCDKNDENLQARSVCEVREGNLEDRKLGLGGNKDEKLCDKTKSETCDILEINQWLSEILEEIICEMCSDEKGLE